MHGQLTRTTFLTTALIAMAAPAAFADGLADVDLANARLLVAVELLLADFYGRALKADRLGIRGRDALQRARFNEREHLASVSGVLTGAGQTPAIAADIDFSYPARSFDSGGGIATTGAKLERLALGAYLGAIAGAQSPSLKLQFAQIAACEARHLTVFEAEATGHALDNSFGDPLTIDEASNELGAYTA